MDYEKFCTKNPYCMVRVGPVELNYWAFLNRHYLPLGVSRIEQYKYTSPPNSINFKHHCLFQIEFSEDQIKSIFIHNGFKGSLIQRDTKGCPIRLYFYISDSNPIIENKKNPLLWKIYKTRLNQVREIITS